MLWQEDSLKETALTLNLASRCISFRSLMVPRKRSIYHITNATAHSHHHEWATLICPPIPSPTSQPFACAQPLHDWLRAREPGCLWRDSLHALPCSILPQSLMRSPFSEPRQHTFNRSLIQSDTGGMSAHGPLTLHSAQTHPASLMGALCQPRCERLLISRLQKASSALTKRGRVMERALSKRVFLCACFTFLLSNCGSKARTTRKILNNYKHKFS